MDVTVSPAQVEEIVVSGLLAELDADLLVRYPGEPTNGIDVSEFRASGGMFFMARIGSQAAGCGAFRPLDQATVEIKRMFRLSHPLPRCTHRGNDHLIGAQIGQHVQRAGQRHGTACLHYIAPSAIKTTPGLPAT